MIITTITELFIPMVIPLEPTVNKAFWNSVLMNLQLGLL